jgi:hypothetical protein
MLVSPLVPLQFLTRAAFRENSPMTFHTFAFVALIFAIGTVPLGAEPPKKIVLLAGPKSHGPVGNGVHDYGWSARLLRMMLETSNVKEKVRVEVYLDGWPRNPKTLEDADTIVVISDGRDGDRLAKAVIGRAKSASSSSKIENPFIWACFFPEPQLLLLLKASACSPGRYTNATVACLHSSWFALSLLISPF